MIKAVCNGTSLTVGKISVSSGVESGTSARSIGQSLIYRATVAPGTIRTNTDFNIADSASVTLENIIEAL